MAIDDVSFYTVTGEEISREYLVDQMISYYGLKLEAGETKVTDFNEGSEIRNILESIAVNSYIIMEDKNELTKIAFVETAEGEYLDMHGANPSIQLERDTGSQANGYVTFKVDEALTTDSVIPEGTIVVNSTTGLEYVTLYEGILSANETEVTVVIECLTDGADGNCGIGEIDTIEDIISDIPTLTVTNESTITGGSDYEEDEEYRQRLLNYKKKDDFGSLPYYMNLVKDIEGVHDVLIVDVSTASKIILKVLVNGDVKPTPVSVLADVLEKYSMVNNHVVSHNFTVDSPEYVEIKVALDFEVSVEIDEDTIRTVVSEIFNGGNTVSIGFDFEGFYMGENVSAEIFRSNLVLMDGVRDVDVTLTVDNTDYDTVVIDEDQVAKLGTVTINQTIVE